MGYINKDKTPTSGETMFVKGKDETSNQIASPKNLSLCRHCKKTRHTQFRCYTKFLKKFETKMSRLMNEFKSLKDNILNNRKGNKSNQKPKTLQRSSKSLPRIKQVWMRNDMNKCQVVFYVALNT